MRLPNSVPLIRRIHETCRLASAFVIQAVTENQACASGVTFATQSALCILALVLPHFCISKQLVAAPRLHHQQDRPRPRMAGVVLTNSWTRTFAGVLQLAFSRERVWEPRSAERLSHDLCGCVWRFRRGGNHPKNLQQS